MNPNQIAAGLIDLGRELDRLVREYRDLSATAADAKRVYERAEAEAYLTSTGPVEERKRKAVLAASDERFAADLAERMVSACKEAIRAVHARIDVGRTLSATTRDEMKLSGVGT